MDDMINEVVNDSQYYIFSTKELDKYDLTMTKENVEELVSEYKEAKFLYFASEKNLKNIGGYYEPKYNQHVIKINDKIGTNVCNKVDAINFIKNVDAILNPLLESLSPKEKRYYYHCLSSDNSEQTLAESLGISRTGLKPIKNNCILKFGLAFNIAVRK